MKMAQKLRSAASSWNIRNTIFALNTENPLRKIWEGNKTAPNPNKKAITLQIGDPTVFGNFPVAKEAVRAISSALNLDKFAYTESAGTEIARKAVADYVNKNIGESKKILPADVILTSGCSVALEICFRSLANPGENILIPRPAWNYTTWICGSGTEAQFYNLDPFKDWNIDLKQMESLINEKTRAILINNPGNPCGNVFSKNHLIDVLKLAEQYKLPIIADEVYENFTFPGVKFHSLASLSENVPILTCSGLTKRFLMPGIRMGWLLIHDVQNVLDELRKGLANIAGRNLEPNSTIQHALPEIFRNTPDEFFEQNSSQVHRHASLAFDILSKVSGLKPLMPKGAMYMMVGIDLKKFSKFQSCLEFTQGLTSEQSVQVLPGHPCFFYPSAFRIVLTVPENLMIEACNRIKEFCETHFKESP